MRLIIILTCVTITLNVLAHRYHNDEERSVFFIAPLTGETVSNPIKITFGAKGVSIVPAGVDLPMSGHHHLLINVDKHTLQLLLGNHLHVPHSEPIISDRIEITVR